MLVVSPLQRVLTSLLRRVGYVLLCTVAEGLWEGFTMMATTKEMRSDFQQ